MAKNGGVRSLMVTGKWEVVLCWIKTHFGFLLDQLYNRHMGDPKNTVRPLLYVPSKAPKGVWAILHWVLAMTDVDVPGGYILLIPLNSSFEP